MTQDEMRNVIKGFAGGSSYDDIFRIVKNALLPLVGSTLQQGVATEEPKEKLNGIVILERCDKLLKELSKYYLIGGGLNISDSKREYNVFDFYTQSSWTEYSEIYVVIS